MAWTSDDDDDDDDEELEVLPPSSFKPPPAASCLGDGRPRLSYSGSTKTDAVNLLDDDDDEDDDQTTNSGGSSPENRTDPYQKRPTTNHHHMKPATAAAVATFKRTATTSTKNVFDVDDDDDDSSVDSIMALAAKLKPRSKVQKPVVDETAKLCSNSKDSKAKASASTKRKDSSPTKTKNQKNDSTKTTKAAVKQLAVAERKRQRELKKAAEEAEKVSRKRHVRDCQQMGGKLAKEEIAILLDAPSSALLCQEQQDDKCKWLDMLKGQIGPRQEYLVMDHSSALPGTAVVQWIRRNALDGGAAAAVSALHAQQDAGYEHIPVIAIVANDQLFLSLLERGPSDDDYPKLAEFIKTVEIGWRASWKKTNDKDRPRIILLLDSVQEALETQWSYQSRKARRNGSNKDTFLPTMEELHDALTWVMIEYQVDTVLCNTDEMIVTHLTKATRMLSERPYIGETSELDCIKKIPQHCNAQDDEEIRVQDTFCRQLQQVPRVSRLMAMSVVNNYYPTLQSLWEDYVSTPHDDDDRHRGRIDKTLLLAPMFNEKKQFPKLAQQIYTIINSDDPDEILN